LLIFCKGLAQLSAAQHADHAPHRMVVDGGGLAWAPHKAHHRKTVIGVGVEQELLVVLGVGLGVFGREPIVFCHQLGQQGFATCQNSGFVGGAFEQSIELGDEVLKAWGVSELGCT
jgi:hypothetical protein